jgi:hypothetical protein
MRHRPIRTIVLCSISGVGVAIASAWLGAYVGIPFVLRTAWMSDNSLSKDTYWCIARFDGLLGSKVMAVTSTPAADEAATAQPELIPWWCNLAEYARGRSAELREHQPSVGGMIIDDGFGWPVRCLTCRWDYTLRDGQHLVGGIRLSPQSPPEISLDIMGEWAFPTQVHPTGLLVSSMFWGTCFWTLFGLPWLARDTARARRGACVWCGHQRAGSPRCPECGRPATSKGFTGPA